MIKTTFGEVPVGTNFYYDANGGRQGRTYKKLDEFTATRVNDDGHAGPALNWALGEPVSVDESVPAHAQEQPASDDWAVSRQLAAVDRAGDAVLNPMLTAALGDVVVSLRTLRTLAGDGTIPAGTRGVVFGELDGYDRVRVRWDTGAVGDAGAGDARKV